MANQVIEDWWRHNGLHDRGQVYGLPCIDPDDDEEVSAFLNDTDHWWDTLSDQKKERYYEKFFSEN